MLVSVEWNIETFFDLLSALMLVIVGNLYWNVFPAFCYRFLCTAANLFLLQNNDHSVKNKREYKRVQLTKKQACPAIIVIRELVYFLDYAVCTTKFYFMYIFAL